MYNSIELYYHYTLLLNFIFNIKKDEDNVNKNLGDDIHKLVHQELLSLLRQTGVFVLSLTPLHSGHLRIGVAKHPHHEVVDCLGPGELPGVVLPVVLEYLVRGLLLLL